MSFLFGFISAGEADIWGPYYPSTRCRNSTDIEKHFDYYTWIAAVIKMQGSNFQHTDCSIFLGFGPVSLGDQTFTTGDIGPTYRVPGLIGHLGFGLSQSEM